jgi:hypothetical protein
LLWSIWSAPRTLRRYRLLDYEAAKAEQERAGKENFRMPAAPAENLVPDPSYMGKGLQLQFTVEDEGAFTTAWSATITYRRPSLTEWPEYICAEGERDRITDRGQAGFLSGWALEALTRLQRQAAKPGRTRHLCEYF